MEVISAIQSPPTELDGNLAIQCALLHDIIEDTEFTYSDVRNEFGQSVADGVLALTKDESIASKAEMMIDSLNRIKQQPYEVWMVKMADRICNLYHPPFYWNESEIASYQKEAVVIHKNLKDANRVLEERLWNKIEKYGQFLL